MGTESQFCATIATFLHYSQQAGLGAMGENRDFLSKVGTPART
jgi:hypothetical protein